MSLSLKHNQDILSKIPQHIQHVFKVRDQYRGSDPSSQYIKSLNAITNPFPQRLQNQAQLDSILYFHKDYEQNAVHSIEEYSKIQSQLRDLERKLARILSRTPRLINLDHVDLARNSISIGSEEYGHVKDINDLRKLEEKFLRLSVLCAVMELKIFSTELPAAEVRRASAERILTTIHETYTTPTGPFRTESQRKVNRPHPYSATTLFFDQLRGAPPEAEDQFPHFDDDSGTPPSSPNSVEAPVVTPPQSPPRKIVQRGSSSQQRPSGRR